MHCLGQGWKFCCDVENECRTYGHRGQEAVVVHIWRGRGDDMISYVDSLHSVDGLGIA